MRAISIQWKISLLAGACLLVSTAALTGIAVYAAYHTNQMVVSESSEELKLNAEQILAQQAETESSRVVNYLNDAVIRGEMVVQAVKFQKAFAEDNLLSSEVLRGAWQALDHGQLEAAQTLGVRRFTIFRLIELPQMLRLALPGLGNLWINLLKDTALVSVIALNDLMRMANVAVGTTKKPFVFFLVVCLIYWAICILFECCLARMEKRANRGLRAA